MISPLVVHISQLLGIASPQQRLSREQQRHATQRLLQLLYPNTTLSHTATWAPYLSGSPTKISLSHSGDYLALLSAPPLWHVGIDLETDLLRPLRLAPRFLSQEEQSCLSALPTEQQARYALAAWCAKEAVYKAIPEASPDFRQHYTLRSYPQQPYISYYSSGEKPRHIPLHFFQHPEYLVAYCALFEG